LVIKNNNDYFRIFCLDLAFNGILLQMVNVVAKLFSEMKMSCLISIIIKLIFFLSFNFSFLSGLSASTMKLFMLNDIPNKSFSRDAHYSYINEHFRLGENKNGLLSKALSINEIDLIHNNCNTCLLNIFCSLTKYSSDMLKTYFDNFKKSLPDIDMKLKLSANSHSQFNPVSVSELGKTSSFWKNWWGYLLMLFIIIAFAIQQFYKHKKDKCLLEEKIRYFYNTIHDIRTMLTLISAPIEELQKEAGLSETGKYYLNLSAKQIKQMSEISSQLLDFQKNYINKDQLNLVMVDIVKLIEYQKNIFEPLAAEKKIRLHFAASIPILNTAIDEVMVERVINNLLSNAIKYSHKNSQIDIFLKNHQSNWVLEVKDTGIGIKKSEQHKIFREFYRGGNALRDKITGSGIGLLLIKDYVTLHGGIISFISEENSGSTFKVIIPIKTIAMENNTYSRTPSKENLPDLSDNNLHIMTDFKETLILIVEDNDELRNFMGLLLQEDFKVLTSVDGAEAWKVILDQKPDLVVSDIMMPNMDGFELCRIMKSTYETSNIPIILLTGLSEKTEQIHGLSLGADDYLIKPFDMTLLSLRIKSMIRNRLVVHEKALKLIKRNQDESILSNDLNDKFIKDALEVVRKHIADVNFGKEKFAFEMNVSSSLLYKKIKSLTNQSPIDFIKTVRLDQALELLESRNHSITEISELCGFSSVGYFCTVFKKQFGRSPTEMLG
jgi:CheY-like chemotaxis protein/AraC-like DNA-binding protein/two-component sensor histidine kinase